MIMSCRDFATKSRQPDLDALSGVDSDLPVIDRIKMISENYGKVIGVFRIPESIIGHSKSRFFFVDFSTPIESIRAARAMQCELCGLSTLVVVVSQKRLDALPVLTGSGIQ